MLISFNIFISFVFLCYPAYIKRLKILRFNYRDQTTLHSSSFIQTKTPLTPPHSLQNLKTSHDTSHVRIITMDTCPLDLACVLDTYNTQPTFTSFVSPFFSLIHFPPLYMNDHMQVQTSFYFNFHQIY